MTIELTASPTSIPVGEPVMIAVKMVNRGPRPITNVRVDLALSPRLELHSGRRSVRLPVLVAGGHHHARLMVRAKACGEHTVRVPNLSYRDAQGRPARLRDVVVRVVAEVRSSTRGRTTADDQCAVKPCGCGSVFVGYRRQDSGPFAGRLARDVAATTRHRVFHDHSSLHPGEDFRERLTAELTRSMVLLALVGPQWLTASTPSGRRRLDEDDDLVRLEIGVALRQGIAVVPVLLGGTRMPARAELPSDIADLVDRQAIAFRSSEDIGRIAAVVRERCRG